MKNKYILNKSVVEAELNARDISKTEASLKLGYGKDYLSHSLSRNREVRKSFVEALAKMIDRTVEDITASEVVKEEKQMEMLSAEQLARCKDIYIINEYAVAVIEAMKNIGGKDE